MIENLKPWHTFLVGLILVIISPLVYKWFFCFPGVVLGILGIIFLIVGLITFFNEQYPDWQR